jgi:lipopolysaccharide/colanic/teichoic acid biosynthesis glycosyltransferase
MSTTDVALDSSRNALAAAQASRARCAASPTAERKRPAALKRTFDVVFALVSLTVTAPVFVMIAVAIKLIDPGPIFYRHRRLTVGGKPLQIYKFRTMHARFSTGERFDGRTDADVFAELGRPELTEEFGRRQKLRGDPRISRIGAWLRRSSLDELPQLWNVLRGDLSTVGPRPIVHRELDLYGAAADLLLSSKPGLTGLWQVSGRSELSYEDRVRLDLQYVQNRNMLLDVKIMLRTLPAVLSGRGAY